MRVVRRILHMDMDAFFAAVEVLRRPELKDRPVVIGGRGDPTRRGVVSTASYEARKFGIHSAMPLKTAHRLCPDAVFLPVDYREYSRVSRIIKEILRGIAPVMEDVGIDEAFLDISSIPESDEMIAANIKNKIMDATGLTCSIGIGPNKLVAKIASDLKKPDGLTVVKPGKVQEVLDPLAVRKLWGVGPKTEERLKKMGIQTVAQLRERSAEELNERFDGSYGAYLYRACRGIDERPLVTEWKPKSASRETTFQNDVSDWQEIARTLAALVKRVVADMKSDGLRGRTITVKIRFSDFTTRTRAKTIEEFTDDEGIIRKAAFDCLGRFGLEGQKVRLVGARVSGFEE